VNKLKDLSLSLLLSQKEKLVKSCGNEIHIVLLILWGKTILTVFEVVALIWKNKKKDTRPMD
jgi:hypothetical protein